MIRESRIKKDVCIYKRNIKRDSEDYICGRGWRDRVSDLYDRSDLSVSSVHGEEVKVYTYLHVREDAMILFGFLTKDDLFVFRLLLGVSGIGPKGALAILSVMTTDDLRFAVLGDDAKAIAKAPGVGAKTAQRLILELKDKLSLEDAFEQKLAKNDNPVQNKAKGAKNEAIEALVALGYSSSEALKALNGIEITDDTDVEDILKAALKNMAFM